MEGRSLSSQGFTNGQMVYLQGSVKSAKSVDSTRDAPLKILRGGQVATSVTTSTTSTTKRTLTREYVEMKTIIFMIAYILTALLFHSTMLAIHYV